MSESTVWFLVAACIGMVVGIMLVILYKRGLVDAEIIHGASAVMEEIPLDDNSSVFGLILKYSRTAVKTVEQLVKTGEISRDDKTRKETAMRIVENAMTVDGIKCGSDELYAISNCIEAEVNDLPRNRLLSLIHEPPDEDAEEDTTGDDQEEPAEDPAVSEE